MKETYSVLKLSSEYDSAYEDYVLSKKNSLLFQSVRYHRLVCDTTGAQLETLLITDETKKIKGVLPLASKQGSAGKVYNSFPFYGSNGGFISDDESSNQLLRSHYNALLNEPGTCLGMISENPLEPLKDFPADITDARLCQFTNLEHADPETGLMDSFHYKTRNVVRKAQKQDMEIVEDNSDFDFLYATHFENMTAIGGKPKPKEFFLNIPRYFTPGLDYKIIIAKKDGIKISALLMFYYNGIAEYYTPVIKSEYRNLQPNSLLIFHAMKEASEKGFRLWNWGGTWKSQEELYRFKSRWGAFDVNYNYYITLKNKDILQLSPETISTEYQYFFTVPFSLLHGKK